jgi:hypothetical protein
MTGEEQIGPARHEGVDAIAHNQSLLHLGKTLKISHQNQCMSINTYLHLTEERIRR